MSGDPGSEPFGARVRYTTHTAYGPHLRFTDCWASKSMRFIRLEFDDGMTVFLPRITYVLAGIDRPLLPQEEDLNFWRHAVAASVIDT